MKEIKEEHYKKFLFLRRGYSQGGIKTALKNFRSVRKWFLVEEKALTKENVETFFMVKTEEKYKNNTLDNWYTVFRLLEHFTGKELVKDIRRPPKVREKPHILSHIEVIRLFAVERKFGLFRGRTAQPLNEVYKTLIMFLYYSGCRISEAVNLRVKHVLGDNRVHFVQTKNGDDRIVYIFPTVYRKLELFIQNQSSEGYVFRSMTENHISIPEFEKDLKWRAKKAGITKRIYPHLLRHTLASHLAQERVDIRATQKILGHRSLDSTIYYEQLNIDAQIYAIHSLPITQIYLPFSDRIQRIKKDIEKHKLEDDERSEYRLEQTTRYGKQGLIFELFEK
jgi:integrase/recombinase XerD